MVGIQKVKKHKLKHYKTFKILLLEKNMFSIFKKKSELDKLQEKYNRLMEEAFKLSTSNRMASDAKYAEADEIAKQLEQIRLKK